MRNQSRRRSTVLLLSFLAIAWASSSKVQFISLRNTGEGGRGSGTSRPPALLPNGNVLIVNGSGSAEIYNARTRTFSRAGSFPVNMLSGATAVGLLDGRALVSGGGNSNVDVRNLMLIWNPQSLTFRQVTGMIAGRRGHAIIQLDANTLLIVGGEGSPDTWETYDIGKERPLVTGALPLSLNTVITLEHPSGKVVFISGSHGVSFDRATFSFAPAHGMPEELAGGGAIDMLTDGRILVTGGIRNGGPGLRGLTSAVIFDPITGSKEVVSPMLNARFWHAVTTLPSGKVLVTGGADDCVGWCKPVVAPAEVFDPFSKTFSAIESMNFPRLSHVPVRLTSGDILLVGGDNGTDNVPAPELYVREGSGPPRRRAVRH